jgi:YbbR domain-containing protein
MRVNLFRNWPLKILAVLIAFFLWFYFTGEEKILKDIDIPLDILVASDKILLGEPSSNVTVRVRATESAISRLGNRFIFSRVDLTDFPPIEKYIQISAEEHIYGLPKDLEVVSITPERFKVTIEERASKKIPVQANIMGQPLKPFAYYGYDIDPRSVLIEGGKKDVEGMEKAITEMIDINGKSASFQISTDIILENPDVKIVEPKRITVNVKIGKNITEKTFKSIPINFIQKEQLFSTSHDQISLTLRGPIAVLEKVEENSIRATINLIELAPSNQEYLLAPIFSFPNLSEQELIRLAITSWSPEIIFVKIQLRSVSQ